MYFELMAFGKKIVNDSRSRNLGS